MTTCLSSILNGRKLDSLVPIAAMPSCILCLVTGVVVPRYSPLMTRQPREDDVDEEERDDPPDWEKMKVGPIYF